MKSKIILIIVLILIVIQFIPAIPKDQEIEPQLAFSAVNAVPLEVESILGAACYDCHSATTKKPWYSQVAPLSFWIGYHVEEGREHLNFSEWGSYSPKKADHKLEEIIEMVEEGEMPMDSYTWMHPEARLTGDQKKLLLAYVQELRR